MSAQPTRLVINPNAGNAVLLEEFRRATQCIGVPYSRALEQAVRLWLDSQASRPWIGPGESPFTPLFHDPADTPEPITGWES